MALPAVGHGNHRVPRRGAIRLTPEAAVVFVDNDNPASMVGGLARLPDHVGRFEAAAEAFRTGLGVTYADSASAEDLVRSPLQTWARNALVTEAFPKLDGLIEALQQGGAVADVGCGAGAAPLAVAEAFPRTTVHGYDNWSAALELCEREKASTGLKNVHFYNNDEHGLPDEPTYDLVLTMDVLHDMARPDLAARAIRQAIKPDGRWFIIEIDGHEDFEENLKNPLAKMMYAASLSVCLQSSASEPDGLALGTLGLPEPRLKELVSGAGFSRFERVPGMHHLANAYYLVRP